MTTRFTLATTDEDFRAVGMLYKEYFEYLESVGLPIVHDDTFNRVLEMSGRAKRFMPPTGGQVLSLCNDQPAGCIAFKELEKNVCEINRLYVRPAHRGKHIGRDLLLFVMEEAKRVGYKIARLDTYTKLKSALKLYPTLGFKQIPSYFERAIANVVYFEKQL